MRLNCEINYKTVIKRYDNQLVLTDGSLKEIGDTIFAYQALLKIIDRCKVNNIILHKNDDFTIEKIRSTSQFDSRLKVRINKNIELAVEVIKSTWKGVVIQDHRTKKETLEEKNHNRNC